MKLYYIAQGIVSSCNKLILINFAGQNNRQNISWYYDCVQHTIGQTHNTSPDEWAEKINWTWTAYRASVLHFYEGGHLEASGAYTS